MFKVVADQLKIAQGWVRCGQCAEVFDASLQLQTGDALALSLQVESVPVRPASEAAASDLVQVVAEVAAQLATLSDLGPGPGPEDTPPLPIKTPEPLDLPALDPIDAAPDTPETDFDPAGWKRARQRAPQFAAPLISQSAPDMPPAIAAPARETSPASAARAGADPGGAEMADADMLEVEAEPEVSFVRDARRKAFWWRPLIRGVLSVLLFFLLILLVLQWVLQHKDRLAALNPQWTPVFRVLCTTFKCELRPPRHIESLVIDSSTFTKTGADTYRLRFALKNAGDVALEVPALELTLTDSQDQAVVRRVLSPGQFGVNVATLAGQSELTGVVSLKVSVDAERVVTPSSLPLAPRVAPKVAGYRILAFYP